MASFTVTKTNIGLNLWRDGEAGVNNPTITYVALGNGTNAPTAGDTTLQNETFRKQVTTQTDGTTGEILITMYLGPNDDIGADIEEVGFFGGSTATSTPNTGILVAHGLWSHNPKANTESITFTLDTTFS